MEVTLERTVRWIDKTQGRDKFCKAIQYFCRFLKHRYVLSGETDKAKKVTNLFQNMRDARKLFRLFKSFNEFKKIQELLKAKERGWDVMASILVRALFAAYWLFDNLSILSKISIVAGDSKLLGKVGSTFWLAALLVNFGIVVKDIVNTLKGIEKLQRNSLVAASEEETQRKRVEFAAAKRKMLTLWMNVFKLIGDMLPAGQGSQMFQKIFGSPASDTICGLGGLVSALITSYQLYD